LFFLILNIYAQATKNLAPNKLDIEGKRADSERKIEKGRKKSPYPFFLSSALGFGVIREGGRKRGVTIMGVRRTKSANHMGGRSTMLVMEG